MDYYGLMKHFHRVACGLALALAATATLAQTPAAPQAAAGMRRGLRNTALAGNSP